MLLAIDTSNDYAGIAVRDERGLLGEATWLAGRQHTEQILPQIDLLLRHLGFSPQDLSVIAVATGPGSWSGLRAGMSLAKALATGRGLPIIGISTLDALARSQQDTPVPLIAGIRLGRDRFGVARYRGDGRRERDGEFLTVTGDELLQLAQQSLLVGDLPANNEQAGSLRLAPASDRQRRAAWIAELAWERHGRGDYDDLVSLEPMYLASPVRTD